MSRMSRRIVVDASVARAAGETTHPVSSRCREFLQDMLTICHRVVMSDDIQREWSKHASVYSTRWLAAMRSRGKVVKVTPGPSDFMEQITDATEWTPAEIAAMEKDLLLPLAAIETDRLVASGDSKVRDYFAKAARHVDSLSSIVWVDPSRSEDHCGKWLQAGARHGDAPTLRSG